MLVVSPMTRFADASGGHFAGLPAKESLRLGARLNCRGVTEPVVWLAAGLVTESRRSACRS